MANSGDVDCTEVKRESVWGVTKVVKEQVVQGVRWVRGVPPPPPPTPPSRLEAMIPKGKPVFQE